MKILVRMTNWIGDCLIATPALRQLRKAYPEAEINVLVQKRNVVLFENNPQINEVIGFDFKKGLKGIRERFVLARELKKQCYDKVFILPRSWDSAIVPYLARIPERIGYANQGRSLLLTESKKRTQKVRSGHQAGYYWNLVAGTDIPKEEIVADLVLDPTVEQWAKDLLSEQFKNKRVIGIAPGATYGSAKMWFPERFAAVTKKLIRDHNLVVIFLGGPKEAVWINALADKIPGVVSFAGKTNLQELAALMQQSDVVLTNDSGPMHVAAAVKVPLVVLFGSTHYESTGPMGEHTLLHKKVDCSPCMLRHCPIDHRCMKQISVEEVVDAILENLEKA